MGYRVVVDYDLCESNAICMQVLPEVFENFERLVLESEGRNSAGIGHVDGALGGSAVGEHHGLQRRGSFVAKGDRVLSLLSPAVGHQEVDDALCDGQGHAGPVSLVAD